MRTAKRKQPVEQTKQQLITYILKKQQLSNENTTRIELAQRFGYHKEYVSDLLEQLREEGVVQQTKVHGEWQLTEKYLKEQQL